MATPFYKAADVKMGALCARCSPSKASVEIVSSLQCRISESVRESSFCAYAIQARELIVPDAWNDERFRNNPLVLHEPHLRFYAGLPLMTTHGFALGALCVIDRTPRPGLAAHERESLALLVRETMTQLELRRAAKELAEAKQTAEDTNAELEAFGAAVAHDLCAPLRHIDSFVSFLAAECQSDTAAHNISRIRATAVEHITRRTQPANCGSERARK